MAYERKKIGEILIDLGALAPAEVRLVLDRQPLSGRRFGELAMAEGLIGEDVLAQALASQFGLPYRDLVQAPPPAEAVELITPVV